MNYEFIAETELFKGSSIEEIRNMLDCLQAKVKKFAKGEYVYRTGDKVNLLGLILSGSVNIERDEILGNHTIFSNIQAGNVFAETYACLGKEPLMINVVTVEKTEILFLNMEHLLKTCSSNCEFHNKTIKNLLSVLSKKNLNLTRKINILTQRSIREKILTYLSFQSIKNGSSKFEIPFNRQQLADYLCVDRSALSAELSRMQKENLISYHKNKFCINIDTFL